MATNPSPREAARAMTIGVVVADDSFLMREAVSRLIDDEPDLAEVLDHNGFEDRARHQTRYASADQRSRPVVHAPGTPATCRRRGRRHLA